MKEQLRGFIEQILDEKVKSVSQTLDVARAIEQHMPIKSLRDIAIGFVYGSLLAICSSVTQFNSPSYALSEEDVSEIIEIVNRRLPKIVEEIERELRR